MHPRFEIVRVLDRKVLLDSSFAAHVYITERPLAPGYYVTVWPLLRQTRVYDDEALYFGPFELEFQANILLRRCIAEYFGEPGCEVSAVVGLTH